MSGTEAKSRSRHPKLVPKVYILHSEVTLVCREIIKEATNLYFKSFYKETTDVTQIDVI